MVEHARGRTGDASQQQQDAVLMAVPQHLVPAVRALLEADGWSDLTTRPPAVTVPLPGDRWDRHAVARLALTAAGPAARILDLLAAAGGAEVDLDRITAAIGGTRMQASGSSVGLHRHVKRLYGDRPAPIVHRHEGQPPHMRYYWRVDRDFAADWLQARRRLAQSAAQDR